MTERPVGVTDLAAAAGVAEYRTRERSVSGNTVVEQYLLYVDERVASYTGMTTTFRTLGSAAATQNFFSIENAAGSTVLVAIRNLVLSHDETTVNITNAGYTFRASRPASLPTGGTTLTKVPFDSAQSSSASVVCRGATASDGGTATAITATVGNLAWRQWGDHAASSVRQGQWFFDQEALIPWLAEDDPVILAANESLLVDLIVPTASDNASTHGTIVSCVWEEFTLP